MDQWSYVQLECGTWYHHPRRLQCFLSRNLIIFKVATWHYRCLHNLKNNCIWDDLQCCLLVPRSLSKPVMLTFALQSRKVLFIEIVFWHVQPRKAIMILAFIDDRLPLQFAPEHVLNMNIERNFEATLWRHRWRHHHKKLFWHNLGRSFHIWGQIAAVFNISNFENGRHFELATNFFTETYSGIWIYQKDNQKHFRNIELSIDALTQI